MSSQGTLFEMPRRERLEVHTHSFVRGPRANGGRCNNRGVWESGTFSHSHPGGSDRHRHPDTGPAAFVIDRDEWLRATGMEGGGKKEFTIKPIGEQFPIEEIDENESTFEVHVVGGPESGDAVGPGVAPAARMVLGFGLKAEVIDHTAEKVRR